MKSRELDALAHSLICRAARSAPPQLSARLEEDWNADLSARRGGFALGCCWATRVIAHDYLAASLAAATSAGANVDIAYAPSHPFF